MSNVPIPGDGVDKDFVTNDGRRPSFAQRAEWTR